MHTFIIYGGLLLFGSKIDHIPLILLVKRVHTYVLSVTFFLPDSTFERGIGHDDDNDDDDNNDHDDDDDDDILLF